MFLNIKLIMLPILLICESLPAKSVFTPKLKFNPASQLGTNDIENARSWKTDTRTHHAKREVVKEQVVDHLFEDDINMFNTLEDFMQLL